VGFHLKEYSAVNLKQIFKRVGFSKVFANTILKGKKVNIPFPVIQFVEGMAERMPENLRNNFLKWRPVSIVFNSIIAAVK
jgi:hypothetical protein